MSTDLTSIPPEVIRNEEADKIKAILPKLAGMKKIIQVTEARAKELLADNPDVFDGDWILKDGAKDRRVVDAEKFVESMMNLKDPDGEFHFDASDLLSVATFPVGKAEKLIMDRMGYPKKMASEVVEGFGDEVVHVGQKSPTLKESK